MKKIISGVMLLLISGNALPCSGTYYAGDSQDAQSIYDDFTSNCCKGSKIIIYNTETGIGGQYTTESNGMNSSCEYFLV